jgi:2-amino-4-hydroxy-6-hydroxymethyldihydropteridine diphosphokinase
MRETVAYLALGSNRGDSVANLRRAAVLLEAQPGITVEARSQLYASQSVEGGGEEDFVNAALRVRTRLPAQELLAVCQEIEAQMGRPAPLSGSHRSGARTLDIDILMFGDETQSALDLQVPHPRALGRAFVLRPLLDVLEGGWVRVLNEDW